MEWFQFVILIMSLLAMHRDSASIQRGNASELKDFHGRLCRLEEKYQQMMERVLSGKK